MLKDKRIKGYILKNVKHNVQDYEDIVQDSFVVYLEKRNAGLITKESSSYLNSIIYTVVKGRRRDFSRNIKRYVLMDDINKKDGQYKQLINAISVDEDSINNVYKNELIEFIFTLNKKEQSHVFAFLNEGTYAKAGAVCNTSEFGIMETFKKIKSKWKKYVRR